MGFSEHLTFKKKLTIQFVKSFPLEEKKMRGRKKRIYWIDQFFKIVDLTSAAYSLVSAPKSISDAWLTFSVGTKDNTREHVCIRVTLVLATCHLAGPSAKLN